MQNTMLADALDASDTAAAPTTVEMLAALVSFDTTSSRSNLPLIEAVGGYLTRLGVPAQP